MTETSQQSSILLSSSSALKAGYSQPQEQSSAREGTPAAKPQVDLLKGLLLLTTALFVLFLFSLPILSWLFNDVLGLAKDLCETPAEEIQCGSGASYMEIAEKLSRRNAHGELVGCSCEDGILQDWACAVGSGRFSISYFIATAPGTGMMAALSAWPILGMWYYGAGTLRRVSHEDGANTITLGFLEGTLIAFQFFYGLFLINTVCVEPTFHTVSVVLFILASVVHYITVAYTIGTSTRRGKFISTFVAVAVAAVVLGAVWPTSPSWLGQHAFWLGECIGLSAGMSLAPILSYFQLPGGVLGDEEVAAGSAAAPSSV